MENKEEIKTESIGTSISSILLDTIKTHEIYMSLAKLGGSNLEEQEKTNRNIRNKRRVRSLPRVIAAQESMIRVSLSIVRLRSEDSWDKKYTSKEEKKLHPFSSVVNDYNELLMISKVLRHCEKCLRDAEWTNTPEDDFIEQLQHPRMNYAAFDWRLTKNFFEMLEDLEDCFVEIYSILLSNGLITSLTTEIKTRSKPSGIY